MNKRLGLPLVIYMAYLVFLTLAPFQFRPLQHHHFPWPMGPLRWDRGDVIANVFLFLPLGWVTVLFPETTTPLYRGGRTVLMASGVSLVIEALQIIIQGRFPSLLDLFTNTLGGGIGFFIIDRQRTRLRHYFMLPFSEKIRIGMALLLFLYAAFLLYLALPGGEPFSNWNRNVRLLIGNNLKQTYPWSGTITALAIYNRALTQDQIKRRYQEGETFSDPTLPYHPIALYTFKNDRALFSDRSSMAPPLDLHVVSPEQAGSASLSIDTHGLVIDGSSLQIASGEGSSVYEHIVSTKQLTVEAWFYARPQVNLGGRLISFVQGHHTLLYIHQDLDEIILGIRRGPLNKGRFHSEGLETLLRSPSSNDPVHLVGVYDHKQASLFVNGHRVAEGFLTNGFFVLLNRFNLDRMPLGGRGLLGLALFWPFGFLLSLSFKKVSRFMAYGLGGLFFVVFLLVLQAQQTVLFFTLRTMGIPVCALCLGMLVGEYVKRKLWPPSSDKVRG